MRNYKRAGKRHQKKYAPPSKKAPSAGGAFIMARDIARYEGERSVSDKELSLAHNMSTGQAKMTRKRRVWIAEIWYSLFT